MSEPIIYIDRSRIREGRLGELERAIRELVDFIEASEPQLISYGFHIDDDGSRMTVVAVHPDSDSLEVHMEVGAPAFREFTELIELEAIDVYGEPSDRVREQLQQKARMLGEGGSVVVHRLRAGFVRFGAQPAS